MPAFDGTGPLGTGPIGWRRGPCGRYYGYGRVAATPWVYDPRLRAGWFGYGFGWGRGFGRGFGTGWGRGFGHGFGTGWGRGWW